MSCSPSRIGKDVVRQALEHFGVGVQVCSLGTHTLAVEITVVELCVAGLIVGTRIGDHVIILNGSRIDAPLHVHVDHGILRGVALRGYDDHTRGAAGTVQGRRSGILQYGYGLDIGLCDARKAGAVGCAVHDDERVGVGIHRADTADVYRTGVSARRTGRTAHLQTGHGAHEGIHDVGRLTLGQVFGLDDGGRTGEGLLFRRYRRLRPAHRRWP